ncbi:MAG: IS1634 family transposase [Nanoarchaeota archaeon]|nr:IS1634 family transposase [Nanoarchaeota archaeon]
MNGRSVRIKSKYIGPYEELCEYFQQAEVLVQHQMHFEYGLSRALYDLTKQLGLTQIFGHNLKKRTNDPHLSQRVMLMVLNRLIWPCAKYSLQKWYYKSDLVNVLDIPPEELSSQKIYRTMDILDRNTSEVETALCKVISVHESITFKTLYLDFTNQESYSRNQESEILAYGHNKRGHDDLYQVNISLCCDAETGIPFFHRTYAGNLNDKQFIKIYAEGLRQRLSSVGYRGRSTLVIDRGINGKGNFDLLLNKGFDYVGGLIESEFPEYFNIRKSSLRKTYAHKRQTKESLNILYTSKEESIYGRRHKVIVFYNKENSADKTEYLEQSLKRYRGKCETQLEEFKTEISTNTFKSKWNNVEKIKKKLKEINKKLFSLLNFEIKSYRFDLTWEISHNEEAKKQVIDNFGKHVLFTNKVQMEDREILRLFFNKDKIEKNFQFLKANSYTNRLIVLGPMLHSKDKRIVSHVYTCIMALQLYQIIRNRIQQSNLELTTQQALEELEEITCYYTKIAGKKEVVRHINSLENFQKNLLKSMNLEILN